MENRRKTRSDTHRATTTVALTTDSVQESSNTNLEVVKTPPPTDVVSKEIIEQPLSTTKKKSGRRKINIEYIEDKNRRQITFSKRKAGLMKKAYELTTLTGTQALLLVASETGHVYTFATPKLQPFVTLSDGKNLIQTCLNVPDENAEEEEEEEEEQEEEQEIEQPYPEAGNNQYTTNSTKVGIPTEPLPGAQFMENRWGQYQQQFQPPPYANMHSNNIPPQYLQHPQYQHLIQQKHVQLSSPEEAYHSQKIHRGPPNQGIPQNQLYSQLPHMERAQMPPPCNTQLIFGRVIQKSPLFAKTQYLELDAICKKWSEQTGVEFICSVAGPSVERLSRDEKISYDVVFGLKIVDVQTHQGPSIALNLEHFEEAAVRLESVTHDEQNNIWLDLAKNFLELPTIYPMEASTEIWEANKNPHSIVNQVDELYLVSSGNTGVAAGNLVFGVLSDAEGSRGSRQVVRGISISETDRFCNKIDISKETHNDRLDLTHHLDGDKAYYLIA